MPASLKQRLTPYAWVDETDALHIDIPAVLAYLGLPDTPQGREHASRLVEQEIKKLLPATTRVIRSKH